MDIDLNFSQHPITGDVSVKKGLSAIFQSLRTIILTGLNEVPFDPDGWGDVYELLGENAHPLLATELERRISDAIRAREPRVDLYQVQATPLTNRHGYDIKIKFYQVNNPNLETITVPLERLR